MGGLQRERSERENEDRALRAIIADVETVVRELRTDCTVETRRLWEAVDSHTHDVNVDETVERSMISDSVTQRRPSVLAVEDIGPRRSSIQTSILQRSASMSSNTGGSPFSMSPSDTQLVLSTSLKPSIKQAVAAQQIITAPTAPLTYRGPPRNGSQSAATASVGFRQVSATPRLSTSDP